MGTRDELARGCQWGAERDAELVVQCIHATNYHSGAAVASSSTTKVSSDNINQSYGFTSISCDRRFLRWIFGTEL